MRSFSSFYLRLKHIQLLFIISLTQLLLLATVDAQTYQLTSLTMDNNTSLRGMSIVSDSIAWVSGSNGSIGKTTNGGRNWKWMKPAGFEKLDFRDIEAFDKDHAVVVNAGSPAYVLLTEDGGKSWKKTYENPDSAIFLDGVDFWNQKNGIIFGDPIKNKLQLLITKDGGLTWDNVSSRIETETATGEGGFAASGSTIKTLPGGKAWIVTGGLKANIYISEDYGLTWKRYDCPIIQGQASTGPFSMDFYDNKMGIVVGGDYKKDKESLNNILLTNDGGKSWNKPSKPILGYRSSVIWFDDKNCFATGTSGTDVSKDAGKNWYNISGESFNVIKRAKTGKLILCAGNKGNIYTLQMDK
jgi:photosystem II stability/assembly factor-like uncharacterized protein